MEEQLIVINGAKMYRKYLKDIRKQNKTQGICKKTVNKKDEHGNVTWSRSYYYVKLPRDKHEQERLIQKGYDSYSSYVRYKEMYLGSDVPDGYEDDVLTNLKEKGYFELEGDNLLTDSDTFDTLLQVAPEYFHGLTIYFLNN